MKSATQRKLAAKAAQRADAPEIKSGDAGTPTGALVKADQAAKLAGGIVVKADEAAGRVTVDITEDSLRAALGTRSHEVAQRLAAGLALVPVHGFSLGKRVSSALSLLTEIAPATALEAMLAVQMVGVHEGANSFLYSALLQDQSPEGRDANVLRATRLMRLFNEQLEAMAKLRGKAGQQKVTVEHVHIHEGGQAVVGVVAPNGKTAEGGGGK
jgi:hypothetical protein